MIDYSVFMMGNPMDVDAAQKAYAKAQVSEIMPFSQFVKHIADHNGVFTRGTVKGVIADMCECLVEMLLEGKNLALITDAGTPGISDPGEELVQMCYEAGVPVTSLPGAAACITALTLSGLSTRRFAFEAFLPSDKKERQQVLEELKNDTRTVICYEAPHRLVKTLKELLEALGNRRITICRELTKKHETAWQTHIAEACEYYQENAPKGECVLVIEGRSREELKAEEQEQWEQMPLEAHMEHYESQGMDHKSAMKQVAKDRGVSKRDIYRMLLELGQSD